jgi:hypothetical protein
MIYYCPRSFILKTIFNSRSKTTREEEANLIAIKGQEEERDYEGNKRPLNPIHIYF